MRVIMSCNLSCVDQSLNWIISAVSGIVLTPINVSMLMLTVTIRGVVQLYGLSGQLYTQENNCLLYDVSPLPIFLLQGYYVVFCYWVYYTTMDDAPGVACSEVLGW